MTFELVHKLLIDTSVGGQSTNIAVSLRAQAGVSSGGSVRRCADKLYTSALYGVVVPWYRGRHSMRRRIFSALRV